MANYEELKKANDSIRTTDIKGKDYAEVNQRIKAFRMVYPDGSIITEMLSNNSGICIFKAMVYDGEILLSTGHAYEKEGSTFINKTSYIENCETSAIGRALGMAGFGIDTSVASAEEVQNAMANQKEDKKPTVQKTGKKTTVDEKWIAAIDAECERTGIPKKKIYEIVGITNESQLNIDIFKRIMQKFEKTPDKASE